MAPFRRKSPNDILDSKPLKLKERTKTHQRTTRNDCLLDVVRHMILVVNAEKIVLKNDNNEGVTVSNRPKKQQQQRHNAKMSKLVFFVHREVKPVRAEYVLLSLGVPIESGFVLSLLKWCASWHFSSPNTTLFLSTAWTNLHQLQDCWRNPRVSNANKRTWNVKAVWHLIALKR